ncbi:MAG: ATP-binding cassette domain-containing protein [Phascolarctobacterium sp.]|nr:ATP-binding cassette domain-containing protein [Phascolarctobacterium sp.]
MLKALNIKKTFYDRQSGTHRTVLDNVSVQIAEQEVLGLMGTSGSGKSTLARIVLKLIEADEGKVLFEGQEISTGKNLRNFRRHVQFVSQRPENFFDPLFTLGQSLKEPLDIFGLKLSQEKISEALDSVQLHEGLLSRYPHQVSGGEIQRLSIARALLLEPKLLVLDEPTAMLDVSVQAQVLSVLKDIHQTKGISYLLISHDKDVVNYMCDRTILLKNGRVV